MIQWRDTQSDVGPAPIESLYATLAWSDVVRLEAALCDADTMTPLIILPASVEAEVRAHLSQSHAELGGLLIGAAYTRARRTGGASVAVVCVHEAIAGDDYASTAVSLRLDASVWTKARGRLTQGRLVVGWYHSHPHIGAFFSDTDRRTQRAFFAHAYSVGWVVDPFPTSRGDAQKFFAGREAIELPDRSIIISTSRALR